MITQDLRTLLPYGSLLNLASELGVSVRKLAGQLADGSLSVQDTERLLSIMGQTKEDWLRCPTEVLGVLGPMPWASSNRPQLVRDLLRASRRLAFLEAPAESKDDQLAIDPRTSSDAALSSLTSSLKAALESVEILDHYRFVEPEGAKRRLRFIATRVAPEVAGGGHALFAAATGAIASCCRVTGHLRIAAAVLRLAFLAAQAKSLPTARARLLRRAASIIRDRYKWDEALSCLTMAAVIYQESWDFGNLARTTADRGGILTDAGRYQEAVPTLQRALLNLPEDAQAHLFAVHHRLAVCAAGLNDLASAEDYLGQAEQYLEPHQTLNKAAFLLERAHLARDSRQPHQALTYYRQARDLLTANPIYQASISLEIAFVLRGMGEFPQLREEAQRMLFVLSPYARISEVSQVIDLVRAVAESHVPISAEVLAKAGNLLAAARI